MVGLGIMGSRMCANLVKAGFEVHAFDVDAGAMKRASGANAAAHLPALAARSDVVVLSLPDAGPLRAVCTGDAGLIKHLPKGAVVCDTSTVDPASAREMAALAEAAGVSFLDCPVSGGPGAVQEELVEEHRVARLELRQHRWRLFEDGRDQLVVHVEAVENRVESAGYELEARGVPSAVGERRPQVQRADVVAEKGAILVPTGRCAGRHPAQGGLVGRDRRPLAEVVSYEIDQSEIGQDLDVLEEASRRVRGRDPPAPEAEQLRRDQ
jgi:hypothetical protein